MGRKTPEAPCGPTYRYIAVPLTATAEWKNPYVVPQGHKITLITGFVYHATGTTSSCYVYKGEGVGGFLVCLVHEDQPTAAALPLCYKIEDTVGLTTYQTTIPIDVKGIELFAGDSIKMLTGDATAKVVLYVKEELI